MKGVSTRFGVFFPGFPRLRLGEITIPQTCKLNRCSDSLLKPEIFISGLYLFFLGLNILQASEICIRRIPELRDFTFKKAMCEAGGSRSEEHTSELQSRGHLVCRLLLEKKKNKF